MTNLSWMGLHFHMIFILTLFLGIILFMVWAIRDLKRKKLFKLFMWMLVVGIVGSALTAYFCAGSIGKLTTKKWHNDLGPEIMMDDGMMNGVNWSFTY